MIGHEVSIFPCNTSISVLYLSKIVNIHVIELNWVEGKYVLSICNADCVLSTEDSNT